MSCRCGGSCCKDTSLGYDSGIYDSGLGAITADQAAQQAMPKSSVRSTPGFTQAVYNDIVAAAQSGEFQAFNPSGCSGVSAGGNLKLIQTGGSLALTGLQIGLTTSGAISAAALAPFTMGISALIGLFPMFFQHHAQAVALEQKTICAAVPAAENYLQVIEQAVQSGQIDPAHGIAALQSLLSDFTAQMSSIMKNTSSACNAACVWVKELTAIVAYQTAAYQDLESAAQPAQAAPSPLTAPPAPSSPAVVTPRPNTVPAAGTPTSSSYSSFYSGATPAAPTSSLPSWWPIAALALGGFLLVRS
jgi:hypothetical protein